MNSKVIETTVYYIALFTVVCVPPAIFLWFLIHPFAFFWRRLGAAATYLALIPILVAMGAGLYYFREPLLSIHFEVRLSLVVIAVFFLAIGIYIGIVRMRHLTISMLIGIPEISKEGQPGKLLTEGIYSHVRNPRYIEIGFGLAGIALAVNYLAVYILVILYIPVIYLVVILEEHELRKRFGAAYDRYCREVPRFIPRMRRRS
ncbi:MAG: isoprenylcysteine carboxylmethyltransferase family protein [Deltaproteobacteria bacterium]|nr:isoprenylcysteine carboxylmethyltransferase family protein [Deltaproteobacteria bacterium]